MLTAADRFEIHETLAQFGHVLDGGHWDRLSEVLTEDFTSDATAVGYGRHEGLATVRAAWSANENRAKAHHVTNIVLRELDDDTVHAVSKNLSVYGPADVHIVTHRDVVRKTDAGWRIAVRVTVSSDS